MCVLGVEGATTKVRHFLYEIRIHFFSGNEKNKHKRRQLMGNGPGVFLYAYVIIYVLFGNTHILVCMCVQMLLLAFRFNLPKGNVLSMS